MHTPNISTVKKSWYATPFRRVIGSSTALFAAYLIAIVARAPILFSAPRFWAESGVVYFLQARSLSFWQALWAKPVGYLSLPANLAGIASAALPILYAPYGDLAVSLLVQLLLFWVVVTNNYFEGDRLKQFFLLAIPIFVIQSFETWLNSINSQFWLVLGAAYILASPIKKFTLSCHVANLVTLTFAALAGVVSSFLAPLFFLRFILERRWIWLTYSGVVAIGAVLLVLTHGGKEHALAFPVTVFAVSSFFQLLLNNLCMPCAVRLFSHTGIISSTLFASLSLMTVGAVVVVIFSRTSNTGRWFLLASLLLLLLSFLGMLGKELVFSNPPHFNSRYFFAPAALFFGALLFVKHDRTHRLFSLILGIFFLNGAYFLTRDTVVGQNDGAHWTDSSVAFYAQRSSAIYFSYPFCGFSPTLADRKSKAPNLAAVTQTDVVFDAPGLKALSHSSVYIYRAQRNSPRTWQRLDKAWHNSNLFLVGTEEYGQCYGGDYPSPATWVRLDENRLVINRARLGDLADNMFLFGYGENFAAMLANKTFLIFSGDAVLDYPETSRTRD
jgi:hypothetical protein